MHITEFNGVISITLSNFVNRPSMKLFFYFNKGRTCTLFLLPRTLRNSVVREEAAEKSGSLRSLLEQCYFSILTLGRTNFERLPIFTYGCIYRRIEGVGNIGKAET